MDDDEVWFRSPEPLGWPLALTAFALGLFAVDFADTLRFACDQLCWRSLSAALTLPLIDWKTRLLVAALNAGAFAVTGRWVSRKLMMGAPPFRTMFFGALTAGGAAACTIGFVTLGQGFGLGVVIGLVCAGVCIPVALLLVHNASWAWRARSDSVLHRTYRRARWIDVATGVTVLLAFYANPMFGTGARVRGELRGLVASAMVFVASSIAAIMMVRAISSLVRMRRLATRFGALGADGEMEREGEATVVDIGIGDDRRHDVAMAASAYRHQARVDAVCVGDLKRAWRVIGLAAARALVVVVVGAVVLGTHVRLHAPFTVDLCS